MTSLHHPAIRWGPGPALAAVIVACGAIAAGLYGTTIRIAGDTGDVGRANARALAEWEASLGLGWTHDLTGTWLASGPLETFWVVVYSFGYWPFLALAAGWALVFDRVRLQHFVVLVGVTGLVGVVVMTLAPVSPPRLVGTSDPISGTALEQIAHPDRLMNEHAAMPSFHVAWSIAAAVTLATARGPMSTPRRALGREGHDDRRTSGRLWQRRRGDAGTELIRRRRGGIDRRRRIGLHHHPGHARSQ